MENQSLSDRIAVLESAIRKATEELVAEYGEWGRTNYAYLWDALGDQSQEKLKGLAKPRGKLVVAKAGGSAAKQRKRKTK